MRRIRRLFATRLQLETLERRTLLDASQLVVALSAPETVELLPDSHRVSSSLFHDVNGDGFADLIVAGTIDLPPADTSSSPRSATSEQVEDPDDDLTGTSEATPSGDGEGSKDPVEPTDSDGTPTGELEADTTEPQEEPNENPPLTSRTLLQAFLYDANSQTHALEPVNLLDIPDFDSQLQKDDPNASLSDVAIADFDADGTLDLLTDLGSSYRILFGSTDKDGTKSTSNTPTFNTQQEIELPGDVLQILDLNHDGLADIVTSGDGELFVSFQVPANADAEPIRVSFAHISLGANHFVATLDADQDGDLDIASLCMDCEATDELNVHLNLGENNFLTRVQFLFPDAIPSPADVYAEDLDEDGVDEIVVHSPTDAELRVWKESNGTFVRAATLKDDLLSNTALTTSINFADVNNDARKDIVLSKRTDNGEPRTTRVFAATDAFQFSSVELPPNLQLLGDQNKVAMSDGSTVLFDADQNEAHYVRQPNIPRFESQFAHYGSTIDSRSAELVDLNGDGTLDLVGRTTDAIEIHLGNPDGSFTSHHIALTHLSSFQFYVDKFDTTNDSSVVIAGRPTDGGGSLIHRIQFRKGVP